MLMIQKNSFLLIALIFTTVAIK